ncbi:ABC transporter ATP-binding protein/permease [Corynebacterium sp. TAE3-ERU30]|nr:ABC transporter ATP-binding protein/permease [Corynebacterium sp. TAE3-ERU30]
MRSPLLIGPIRRLLTDRGRSQNIRHMALTTAMGVVDGLAMLALLPTAMTMAVGGTSWGFDLTTWLFILAGLALISAVLRYRSAIVGYDVALDLITSLHHRLGDRLAALPLGWFRSERTGGLSQLVTDGFMSIGQTLAHMMATILSNAATMLVIVIGAWFWDPTLGLALTAFIPVVLLVNGLAQWLKAKSTANVVPKTREVSHRIVEFSACQPALRAAGRSSEFAPLRQATEAEDKARLRDLWMSLVPIALAGGVVQMVLVVMISATASLAINDTLGPLQTIAIIGLTLRYSQVLNALMDTLIGMDMARAPLDQAMEILDAEVLSEPSAEAELPSPGEIEFDNVSFGYDAESPVIHDLSFSVPPRTMVALVGPSGSGKTTVARLISRFWDVDSGVVRVGGVDVRDQTTEQLMRQISMVFQDVYLFDDTLMENIRVGREGASDDEVKQAAALTGVTSIAERLPDGWNARVGEGGRSLSGGERQRVSVARALLKKAPIVLLDEATSALDAENEANIVASVDKLRDEATVLVIAHKLDTVREADNIIVLSDDGHIAEHGTHTELYAANGPYRRFWNRREAASGWSITTQS